MPPVMRKYIFSPPGSESARMAKGVADSKMNTFLSRMGKQNGGPEMGWQGPIHLQTGQTIYLSISPWLHTIEIHAAGETIPPPGMVRTCLCNCNMALGTILTRTLTGTEDTPYVAMGLPEAPFYVYSVEVCQDERAYVLFENVLGADFTPWEEGQQVLVMAYYGFSFGCCYDDWEAAFGSMFAMNFSSTGCAGQESGLTDFTDEAWRPPYRILQLCALNIPPWIDEYI